MAARHQIEWQRLRKTGQKQTNDSEMYANPNSQTAPDFKKTSLVSNQNSQTPKEKKIYEKDNDKSSQEPDVNTAETKNGIFKLTRLGVVVQRL